LLKLWACRIKTGSYRDSEKPIQSDKRKENEADTSEKQKHEREHQREKEKEQERERERERDQKRTGNEAAANMCKRDAGFNGEGVICSPNGDQCKTAAIQCFKSDNGGSSICSRNIGAGQLLSTLHDGSGEIEPDQSQLESLMDNNEKSTTLLSLGDFFVSFNVYSPELILNVFDKTGTYIITNDICKGIKTDDWIHFTSIWQSLPARNINMGEYLKPLKKPMQEYAKPFCSDEKPQLPPDLDFLFNMMLTKGMPQMPETDLSEWLGLLAGDQESSTRELGAKIAIALKENSTSWVLNMASSFYWRIVGNTKEAITCFRHAIAYAPSEMKDIPLLCLTSILYRAGFYGEALELMYLILASIPNYAVNHFMAGNILTAMEDYEGAINFYRTSLALDANFEPAKNRLTFILCHLLLDDSGRLRKIINI